MADMGEVLKITGAFLISAGLYVVLTRTHVIGILIGLELAFNGAVILIVSSGGASAVVFALFLIAFAVAETSVGLAIAVRARRQDKVELDRLTKFRF